jgi:hypothetical protein
MDLTCIFAVFPGFWALRMAISFNDGNSLRLFNRNEILDVKHLDMQTLTNLVNLVLLCRPRLEALTTVLRTQPRMYTSILTNLLRQLLLSLLNVGYKLLSLLKDLDLQSYSWHTEPDLFHVE